MRVLVVDDDKLVAVSLKTILEADGEITVVGLGEAGDDAIRLYREQHPDILLMDIRMQGMSGLDAAECILKEDQAAKILFLTTFSDDEYIVKALNMGAKGYLLKQDFESIVPALKAVYGGQSVFGGQIMGKIPVHGFFPAPRNAGGKNLALLQCDERLNFQRASRNPHHFSDSSAML